MTATAPTLPEARVARRPVECPVEDWLAFLGHRWNALLLWHLQDGARRHGELAVLMPGVSPKVLSERLDGLRRRALIERTVLDTFPQGVRYGLTPAGSELLDILNRLEIWARMHGARAGCHASEEQTS